MILGEGHHWGPSPIEAMTVTTNRRATGRDVKGPRHLAPREKQARYRGHPLVGRLLTALLLVLLAVTLVTGYGTVDNRWYKVVAVKGGSMAPTIEPGDLVFIGRADHLEIGDIGVFQVNGKVVTHRVVGINADGTYMTQGDANPTPDRWEGADINVVGRYLFRIPMIGAGFSSGVGAWYTDSDSLGFSVSEADAT
jgi:signal peptidase I